MQFLKRILRSSGHVLKYIFVHMICTPYVGKYKDTLCEKGLSRRPEPARHARNGRKTSSICALLSTQRPTIIEELVADRHDEILPLLCRRPTKLPF